MSLLALQYPTQYKDIFEAYSDFHVWDMTQANLPERTSKPTWFDYSQSGQTDSLPSFDLPTGVILPSFHDPNMNILNISRFKDKLADMDESGLIQTIGLWRGERRHLLLLSQVTDLIALPHFEYRRLSYVSAHETSKYHLYGFCNIDELRRFPVRSLSTAAPITAALQGIDLSQRERRPKYLPTFSYSLKLNERQLELAVKNVEAVKEALNSHGGRDVN